MRPTTPRLMRNIAAATLLAAAALGLVIGLKIAVTLARTLLHGEAPDWSSLLALHVAPGELLSILLFAAMMTAEMLIVGWHDSSARILLGDSDSGKTDLWCLVLGLTRADQLVVAIATFGTFGLVAAAIPSLAVVPVARDLPFWLAAPLAVLVVSFVGYWSHRMMHTALFWPLHAFHHAADELTVATAFRGHPLDLALEGLLRMLVPAMLGFPGEAILFAALCMNAQTLYSHSRMPGLPALERLVVFGPRAHELHHSVEERHHDRNFGTLVIWDRLFGTYIESEMRPVAIGVDDPERLYRGNALASMLAVQASWMRQIGILLGVARNRADISEKVADARSGR
ncbi:sterol desaturase family protein [Falsiroseomonas sp. HW251]|uniref:sterol desaturase family protein n=1 Tax=Falsiroseomonas sp. HW251 TaxID=3390998 RepID=UPI003D316BA0